MENTVDTRLRGVIESYVRERLSDLEIDEVRVESGLSVDGDDIVNVTVIFGRPPEAIRIGNLTRSLWERLASRNDALFPIFSFLTREENAELSAAA